MSKPTPEQIVAALRCHGCSECPNCDYFVNDTGSCDGGRIAKEAANLIEAQAARIRELEAQVDVVEVVRCKDCKWVRHTTCAYHAWINMITPDGYCSDGERREDS